MLWMSKNVANGVKLIFCAVNLDKKELVALEEAYAKRRSCCSI